MKKKFLKNQSGQVIVLGALGVLLVALMMLITLNVGKAVYEKVRIQQLADSEAFSTATLAARSFNFFAYTNRANIAGLVAAASAHGFMSLASTVPGLFKTAMGNFFVMAGIEFGLCCACPFCSCVIHCIHGLRDIFTALDYMDRGDQLADSVKKLDRDFINVLKALDAHVKAIAAQQQALRYWTEGMILANKVAEELKKKYSPGSDHAPMNATGILNVSEYQKVFETDKDIRKWLGTEIANGTRYNEFVTHRQLWAFDRSNILLYIFGLTLKEFAMDIPQRYTNGFSMIIWHEGESRIVEDGTNVKDKISSSNHGPAGKAAAGADDGLVASYAYCAGMIGPYDARVGSNHDSGEHKCSAFFFDYDCCNDESAHRDAFKCLGEDGELIHNCFMVFHSNKEASEDFGQPRFYSLIKSDLRRTRGEGGKIAWEVTDNGTGKIKVDFGDIHNRYGGKEVQISDNPDEFGQGVAVSKAMAYYHHPDWQNKQNGWKESPNFFNPYWKAKLQPFRDTVELALALGTESQRYGALLLGGLVAEPPLP